MSNLVVQLAESVSGIGVKAAYGDPVDIGGTTITPVALSYYGFGGGSDPSQGTDGAAGGGGGGASIPIGAYVNRGGELRFEPNVISLLAVGIPFVWVAGKALSKVIRALKK
jgi:uncharacterized spore protein YtfJ